MRDEINIFYILDIYIQFPVKFKFEMSLFPEPAPTAIGFAGGFVLGDNSNPVLSAYVQVCTIRDK